MPVALLALVAVGCSGSTEPAAPPPPDIPPVTFAAFGDTPYSEAEAQAVPRLISEVNAANVDFSVFLGDLKGGGPCQDAHITGALQQFNAFTAPLVYTPGDNEWTDCHAFGQDPLERLDLIRRTMFATDHSYGQRTLTLEQQRPEYPENARWQIGPIQFVTAHVVGSNNNHISEPFPEELAVRSAAQRQAAEAEYQARDTAGRAWLHETFARARANQAAMVVIFMQADPYFELTAADVRALRRADGFDRLLETLRQETAAFARPVVLVHGDTHRYRLDTPMPNLTRIESYGSPDVGWVAVTLDPDAPEPVRVVPHLVVRATRP